MKIDPWRGGKWEAQFETLEVVVGETIYNLFSVFPKALQVIEINY